jgi:uncharacterized membrane protein
LTPPVLLTYLKLLFIFLLIAIPGILLFNHIFKTKNKALLIGGGMILGPLYLTLLLSILSYLFKGPLGIGIICIIYLLSTAALTRHTKLTRPRVTPTTILYASILTLYITLFLFFAGNNSIGGDAATYWGLAASFAKGNYPTVLPWQSAFLSVYHSGTFLIHGTIKALTGVRMSIIHTIFSVYTLSAIFLFLLGMAREKTRSPLALLPSILTLLVFSPLYLTSGYDHFIQNTNLLKPRQTLMSLTTYPRFDELKGQVGIGASSLDGFIYINFMLFGLAEFLIFLYALYALKTSLTKKYIALISLTMLAASIDETFFLVQAPLLMILFLKDLYSTYKSQEISAKRTLQTIALLVIVGVLEFLLIQNPIRDSLLTPAQQMPRFTLISGTNPEFKNRVAFFREEQTKPNTNNQTTWYTPDIRVLILIFLTTGFLIKSRYTTTLSLTAALSLIFALFLLNTYWPENGHRFTIRAYHLVSIALSFALIDLWIKKNKYTKAIAALLILLLIPNILTAHAKLISQATLPNHTNLRATTGQYDELLTTLSKKIPPRVPTLFIDEYPITDLGSALNGEAVTNFGFFVPTAPPTPKIVNFDAGVEWFDAITTLDPESVKKLNVHYVFIKTKPHDRFSQKRMQDIHNTQYFKKIYTDTNGTLYKITDAFKNLKDEEQTIQKIMNTIPNNTTIYLPRLQLAAVRNGLILNLSQRTHLIGPPLGKGEGYFLFIEYVPKYQELKPNEKIDNFDYLITDAQAKPTQYSTKSLKAVVENKFITLWKTKDEQ